MPNAEYGNLRAILWRYCGCGWGWRTTYKGLRQHQVKAGCGWDSDLSRTTGLWSTKAARPAWSPRALKGCDRKDYKPSHPVTRPSSPAVLLCHYGGVSRDGASQRGRPSGCPSSPIGGHEVGFWTPTISRRGCQEESIRRVQETPPERQHRGETACVNIAVIR